MQRSRTNPEAPPIIDCYQCELTRICFPTPPRSHVSSRFSRIVQRGRVLNAGARLCHAGEAMAGVYAVRSGALKSVHVSAEGCESVVGFAFAGELVGLDAIATQRHPHDVIALERTTYCVLPKRELVHLAAHGGGREELLRLVSSALHHTQQRMRTLTQHDARALLSSFVLDMAQRLQRSGAAPRRLRLSMRWRDVASYLGLTFETVSRALAWLRANGVLQTPARRLVVLDSERLARLAKASG